MSIIPIGVKRFVSSPRVAETVENTITAVSVETGLKMIGRPTYIMLDKEADSNEKKKFAATKEMLYQGICLTIYLSTMKHVKHFFYEKITKWLGNKNPENKKYIDEYNNKIKDIESKENELKIAKKAAKTKAERKIIKEKALDEIINLKLAIQKDKKLHLPRGVKEVSAIIGSVIMLTIVAPQISHFIIHPLMNALGFDKASTGKKANESKSKELAKA